VPLATLIVITVGAAAVNTRFRSLPFWAMLNVPEPKLLENPPVPFVADVVIRNFVASKPAMPPDAVAIVQV
jgi:hypothetical protein